MKIFYFTLPIIASFFILTQENSMAQTISWPAGYQGIASNQHNKSFFIHYKDGNFDTDTTQNIDIPVEATCLAYTDPNSGKLLFYSNGCKLYDPNGRIVLGSELLNEGALANDVCDKYGYLMDYSMLAVQAPGSTNKVFIIHMKGEDLGDPFYQFTSLLYTTISHSNEGTNLRVENINMPLLSNKKLMPFSICRHANGRDWWLICSEKLTGQYHLFLLDPNGFQFKGIQTIRNSIMPFECSEGQRLLFSPQADILAKHSNCGILLMNFDRCEGLIDFRYWQDLPFQKVPGGDIAFSATGRYLFVSRRESIIRLDLNMVGVSATPYKRNSITTPYTIAHQICLMPNGELIVSVPNSEKSMHLIVDADNPTNYRFFANSISFPYHIMRSIPHLVTADPGAINGGPCDSLSTDVIDNYNETKFYLYPNPASEAMVLKNIFNHRIQFLKIMDLQGKLLYTKEVFNHSPHVNLDISHLPSGNYYLQVFASKRTELLKFTII